MIHPVLRKTIEELNYDLGACRDITQVIPIFEKSKEKALLRIGRKERTKIMGIVNITANSLSGSQLKADGDSIPIMDILLTVKGWVDNDSVHIVDIGGESSRPGSQPIKVDEELRRVVPLVRALRNEEWACDLIISIDTAKAAVAAAAIEAGANMVNDVTGGREDPSIIEVCAKTSTPMVIMHSRGTPETMNSLINYDTANESLISIVAKEINQRLDFALIKGLYPWQIITDPGIGFAKKLPENIELLKDMEKWKELTGGFATLIGTSNKNFIGTLTNQPDPEERDFGTAATITAAISSGVDFVRVHNVTAMDQVARVADAIYKGLRRT